MDVSIVIVNYNTCELLHNCIESIITFTLKNSYEIIIVDNGSTDGSIDMIKTQYPNIKLVCNEKNVGFGAANNQGKKIAEGKYIFYLNSDTYFLNDSIKYFFDYFENNQEENIGCLGANLLNKDLTPGFSFFYFASYKREILDYLKRFLHISYDTLLRFFLHKKNALKNSNIGIIKLGRVDGVLGADMFMKNDDNALFDEYFFMYHEEADLQLNLCRKELYSFLIDGPKIVHLGGGSSGIGSDYIDYTNKITATYNHISKVKYFRKNLLKKNSRIITLKLLITLIWLNPYVYKHQRGFIKELWNI